MSIEPTVTYSIKEVLDRIEAKVDKYFSGHDDRFINLEGRMARIETEHAKRTALREAVKWLTGAAAAIAAAVAAIVLAIHGG